MVKATTLIDDVDGNTGATERFFSIGGTDYAIDLTEDNHRKFLRAIDPWRSRARVARKRRQNPAPILSAEDRKRIREWATANNRHIAARGRFPADVVHDYYKSQGKVILT